MGALAGLALGLLVATGAACASVDDPARTTEIVVPLGTTERLGQGESVDVMPAELRFQVGDTLRIRNDDTSDQAVGPYWVAAGEQFELTFGSPGRFEGMCALSEGDRYEIVITE